MKKIIYSLFMVFTIFSCTSLILPSEYKVDNQLIKEYTKTKIDGEIDFIFAKAEYKVSDVFVKDHKLNIVLRFETSNILGAILDRANTIIYATVESDVKYLDGKLYTKNIRLKKVEPRNNERLIKAISNSAIYSLLDNRVLLDLNQETGYLNAANVRNIYVGEENIIINFK